MAARRPRALVLLVLVFLLSCRSVPRQFDVESVYPSHFITDNRNILFACESSQLNIEGFWLPCLLLALLSYFATYRRHYNTPRRLVDIYFSSQQAVKDLLFLDFLSRDVQTRKLMKSKSQYRKAIKPGKCLAKWQKTHYYLHFLYKCTFQAFSSEAGCAAILKWLKVSVYAGFQYNT